MILKSCSEGTCFSFFFIDFSILQRIYGAPSTKKSEEATSKENCFKRLNKTLLHQKSLNTASLQFITKKNISWDSFLASGDGIIVNMFARVQYISLFQKIF